MIIETDETTRSCLRIEWRPGCVSASW